MPINHLTKGARRFAAASLLALTATACDNMLVAENLGSPDVNRVFATPAAVEQTLGTGYQACHNGVVRNDVLMPQLLTVSLESYSGLNNFNMGVRAAIPRTPIQNYTGAPSIFNDYSALSRAGRLAANAVNALDKLIAEDVATPENGVLGSKQRDLRARSFGFFVIGCNQGWLAMVYDSAGRVVPGMPSDSVPPLSPAKDVMEAALAMFDSAIVIANQPDAAGFSTEAAWLGGTSLSQANYIRLVRSWRARFRAGVARTPAERDLVDWDKVIADAEAGITSDHTVAVGGSTGWSIGFTGSQMYQDGRGWSQLTPMYHGMADISGGYLAWLNKPLTERAPFLIRTPDRRWPQGDTRDAQVSNSTAPANLNSLPFILASKDDETGDPWGTSYYQSQRTRYIRLNNNQGAFPEMVKAEIDLLAAEGYIRKGDFAKAAAKIDISRTRAGLPLLAGVVTNLTTPVPGGTSCVPQVPVPGTGGTYTTVCGNIWEAMKYEKRMETGYTSYGRWWFDSRGWGDLIEGTPTEYPVPYQEMNARQKQPYSLGGGLGSSAARGTYGF